MKTEVLGEKHVTVPLCPPQIPALGMNPGLRSERLTTSYLSHGMATFFFNIIPLVLIGIVGELVVTEFSVGISNICVGKFKELYSIMVGETYAKRPLVRRRRR